jgi:hypothetical protein
MPRMERIVTADVPHPWPPEGRQAKSVYWKAGLP